MIQLHKRIFDHFRPILEQWKEWTDVKEAHTNKEKLNRRSLYPYSGISFELCFPILSKHGTPKETV